MTDELKFTKTHEWLRLTAKVARVGITDHAQQEISDVVFVELPKVGRKVSQGEEAAVVESVKSAFSIYAPISGTIVKVNDLLTGDPGAINRSPYEEGWIFEVEASNPAQVQDLLDHQQYDQWIKGAGHET